MKKRATALRAAASRAKALLSPLGTHLDLPVTTATTKDVWHGPYAADSTGRLQADQKSVRGLADDLRISAEAWLKEAERLETAAAAAPK
jgi:hypothetical protein